MFLDWLANPVTRAALPGLLETGLPLLVVPLGTANDLARALELPADPLDAARLVVDGGLRRIDAGRVNEVPFVLSIESFPPSWRVRSVTRLSPIDAAVSTSMS